MTIPSSSLYPSNFDTDQNLFLVHDSLRVVLAEDYNPGDVTITVSGDTSRFPPTGMITLTDQCSSDTSIRALSFFYGLVTATTFEQLELLPGFTDVVKQKLATNVTENVMAEHHDSIKNAIIAIETFAGVKGTTDLVPLGETMEGRTNFLQNLVLSPRAWFSSNTQIGIVPLEVTFTDSSFRNPNYWKWCFGDGSSSSSVISTSSNVSSVISISTNMVPSGVSCVIDGKQVIKTYYQPGYYSVSLTVSNAFGSDELVFSNMINARTAAPDPATLEFVSVNTANQNFTADASLATGGVLKSKVNTIINIQVVDNGARAEDPVTEYIWKLQDQLSHSNSIQAEALYDTGGLYNVKLRVNTQFGAYRTTIADNAIDIIENNNLWYSVFQTQSYQATKKATTYEFGLISQVFKTKNRNSSPLITRDYSFLTGQPQESQQKKEFLRNVGFQNRNTTSSGDRGTAFLYWSSGYNSGTGSWTDQKIQLMEYEGFSDCYATNPATVGCNASSTTSISRAWNWVSLNTPQSIYFLLGNTNSVPVGNSPTNQTVTQFSLQTLASVNNNFTLSNYSNGAQELMNNVDDGVNGNFSVYRSAWLNSSGFILRNDANGVYFRIKSFYQTNGIISNLVQGITKLNDMPGTVKTEGQLVPLISGVYFFNNSGEVLAYDPTSATWAIGGPGNNSVAFASLQDSTVSSYQDLTVPGATALSFDDTSQKLIATSDSDRQAYISFDYSTNAFIKFNEVTKSFSSLPPRPAGEQFLMGIF